MSKSKAELSITKRLLLDFIKYKTNNNHTFFMGNDKIAASLGLCFCIELLSFYALSP